MGGRELPAPGCPDMDTVANGQRDSLLRIDLLPLGAGSTRFSARSLAFIGFTVLYIPVIAAAAWIATSSPRFSYLGVQLAVAFCLINLEEFRFQTSLAVARDRVVGILSRSGRLL